MLKNSEIEVRRKSRFRAHSVVYDGSCHSKAYERVVRSKTGRSAEPPRKFPSRLPAVFGIVIEAEIRVFQQYRRIAVVHAVVFERLKIPIAPVLGIQRGDVSDPVANRCQSVALAMPRTRSASSLLGPADVLPCRDSGNIIAIRGAPFRAVSAAEIPLLEGLLEGELRKTSCASVASGRSLDAAVYAFKNIPR